MMHGETPASKPTGGGETLPAADTTHLSALEKPLVAPWLGWLLAVGLGVSVWAVDGVFGWRPTNVSPAGWRLLAIFLATILAFILRPLPDGAIVLLAIVTTLVTATLSVEQALAGYAEPTVWLVLAAYMIARAVIKTGLARRIALYFIRALGARTLGLAYALVATDTLLAGVIPSNAARVGGVILPIARALAEHYRSYPGPSAALLGTFLMLAIYQSDIVACAMFYTGQASNPLAALEAARVTASPAPQHVALLGSTGSAHVHRPVVLHYGNWLLYTCLPALVSLVVVPALTYRWCPPRVRHTPDAPQLARDLLQTMGPMSLKESIVLIIFGTTCLSWMLGGFLLGPKSITIVALMSVALLMLTGVLEWRDVVEERGAWNVFLWYGGLVQLGNLLRETSIPQAVARGLADYFGPLPLVLLFLLIVLVYFYAHYMFASITSHIVALYGAFAGILIVAGIPAPLAVACLAFLTNLSAGLTHYGTTHGPILFSVGYASTGEWWRLGLRLSFVNLGIWLAMGLVWWKLLGLW
ncbi:MAG: SLC13 family permease [Gemmatales bacterium]|nr:anion permease [Gemmatales bacterium]MDW7993942.1 SLC13 family permease [Gemmatales bacterium]